MPYPTTLMKGLDTLTHDKGSISIVMTCYNSMRYITEQLDSLRTQTLSPDEVIIADDHSTDGTYEYMQEYISRYGLNWNVYQNTHNIGVVQNFRTLLTKCRGEYIFTCDHDDIWVYQNEHNLNINQNFRSFSKRSTRKSSHEVY